VLVDVLEMLRMAEQKSIHCPFLQHFFLFENIIGYKIANIQPVDTDYRQWGRGYSLGYGK